MVLLKGDQDTWGLFQAKCSQWRKLVLALQQWQFCALVGSFIGGDLTSG